MDELRVLNLKGFECVRLVWEIVEGMMIFTKCARIEYKREEFELEIYNKKRWLIVAPFHGPQYILWRSFFHPSSTKFP